MEPQASPNTQRSRLTVAMIVRNETDVLPSTLGSVWSIADEIVVLDTGSTDSTVATARRLHATVEEMPWDDDFAAARNHCLQRATGDWVLWLDAGERLETGKANELRKFIDEKADANTAYLLLVEMSAPRPNGAAEQVAQVRLVPRRPGLRFEGRVRETLRPSLEAAGMLVDLMPGRILRHPRIHQPQRKTQRAQRDLDLVTREAAERGGYSPRLLLALGAAYADLENFEGARHAFLQVIAQAPRGSTEMLEAYYGLLTALDPQQQALQVSTCLEALEIFPLDAQLLLAMGNYLQAQGRLDLATQSFEAAVKFGQVDLETWHLRELAEVAALCYSTALQGQNRTDECRKVLEQTLVRSPGSQRVRRRLLEVLVRTCQETPALHVAELIPMDRLLKTAFRNAVQAACRAARGDWKTALGMLQRAYSDGCNDPFCLRWLSAAMIVNDHPVAAERVVLEWQKLEPDHPEAAAFLQAIHEKRLGEANTNLAASVMPVLPGNRKLRLDGASTIVSAPAVTPIVSQASTQPPQ